MVKISAVIIAKDEEKMIGDALKSVSFCDEAIVIDNDSKDSTRDIAEKQGAKVFQIKTNNFAELRNVGLEKAENEWILYIDADERVDEELRNAIEGEILSGDKAGFFLRRKNYYLGKHEWPYKEKLERLFKKSNLKSWKGELHESPIVEGELGTIGKGYILHFTHRDLESMVNKTIRWSSTEALLRYNNNHPKMTWWRFPRVMIGAFLSSYIKQQGFKAGVVGVIESVYQAFSMFITYAKLWELQNKVKK